MASSGDSDNKEKDMGVREGDKWEALTPLKQTNYSGLLRCKHGRSDAYT